LVVVVVVVVDHALLLKENIRVAFIAATECT